MIIYTPEDTGQHKSVLEPVIRELVSRGHTVTTVPSEADCTLTSFARYLRDDNPRPVFYIPHGIGVVRKYLYLPEHTKADYIFHSGPMFVNRMESLYPDFKGENLLAGFPKCDGLVDGAKYQAEEREALVQEFHLDPTKPVFLFAPTWKVSIVYLFDVVSRLSNVIVAPHEGDYRFVDHLNLNMHIYRGPDLARFILGCDCILGDFSSVLVESLVLDKPVIHLMVANNTYDAHHEGWDFTIGPLVYHGSDLADYDTMGNVAKITDDFRDNRATWRKRLLFRQDGNTAARIAADIEARI